MNKLSTIITLIFAVVINSPGFGGKGGGTTAIKSEVVTITTCNNEDMTMCQTHQYIKYTYPDSANKNSDSECFIDVGDSGKMPCPK